MDNGKQYIECKMLHSLLDRFEDATTTSLCIVNFLGYANMLHTTHFLDPDGFCYSFLLVGQAYLIHLLCTTNGKNATHKTSKIERMDGWMF